MQTTYSLAAICRELRVQQKDPRALLSFLRDGVLVASVMFPDAKGELTHVPQSSWKALQDKDFRPYRYTNNRWKIRAQAIPAADIAEAQSARIRSLLRGIVSGEIGEDDRAAAAELVHIPITDLPVDSRLATRLHDSAIDLLCRIELASTGKFIAYVESNERLQFFGKIGVNIEEKKKNPGGRKRLKGADACLVFLVGRMFSGEYLKQDAIIDDVIEFAKSEGGDVPSREWVKLRVTDLYATLKLAPGERRLKVQVIPK